MKKLRVTWTTTEEVEWEATIEVADDVDPDSLNGNSQELVAIETPTGGDIRSFYREIESVEPVEDSHTPNYSTMTCSCGFSPKPGVRSPHRVLNQHLGRERMKRTRSIESIQPVGGPA